MPSGSDLDPDHLMTYSLLFSVNLDRLGPL